MGLKPQLITDDLFVRAQKMLQTISKENRAAIRLRAIVSAKTMGMETVAAAFGVTTNTLRAWIKSFEQESLEGLGYKPGRGRKSALLASHVDAIRNWVVENPGMTLKEITLKLNERYDIITSKSAVHRVLQTLKLSYITPRPVHHKQDPKTHPEFKKKS